MAIRKLWILFIVLTHGVTLAHIRLGRMQVKRKKKKCYSLEAQKCKLS